MTFDIDVVIEKTEELGKLNREQFNENGSDIQRICAEYHEQLAEWLKELKHHIATWAFVDRSLRERGFACVKYVIKKESEPDIEKWVKIQEDNE